MKKLLSSMALSAAFLLAVNADAADKPLKAE